MSQHDLGKVLKGLYAGLVAFLGGLSAVLTGNLEPSDLTAGQWVTLALAAILAFGGTFGLAPWPGPKGNGAKGPNGSP